MDTQLWENAIRSYEQQNATPSETEHHRVNELQLPSNREVIAAAARLEEFLLMPEGMTALKLLEASGQEIELGTEHTHTHDDPSGYKTYVLRGSGLQRDFYTWSEHHGDIDPDPWKDPIEDVEMTIQDVVEVAFNDTENKEAFTNADEFMHWIESRLNHIAEKAL